MAWEHGCLIEDKHVTACASYSINPKGTPRWIKTNDSYVGSVVKEVLPTVQFTVSRLSWMSAIAVQ
jgi:hypothetical protein